MKITQVRLGRISTPLRVPFKTALRTVNSVEDVIVELHTDTGAVGYGEAPPTGVITGDTTGAILGAIQDHIAPALLGRDLDEFEDLTAAVQKALVHNTSAKAAVDMALWDLLGQKYSAPVYRMLGGARRNIVTDITISVNPPEEMARDARTAVQRGYDCLKVKVGIDPELDVARLAAVRQAVGRDIKLRIDANQAAVTLSYTAANGQQRRVTGLEGWERNAAGIWFNPTYGFGLIDVNKALASAATYNPLPELVQLPWQKVTVQDRAAGAIPDLGSSPTTSSTRVEQALTVEAVQVQVSLDHQRLPDLLIELISPSGTRSVLLNPNNSLVGQSLDRQQLGYVRTKGLRDMRMLSHKFYGESAQGQWQLAVTDVASGTRQVSLLNRSTNARTTLTERNNSQPGQLLNWSLRVIGHEAASL